MANKKYLKGLAILLLAIVFFMSNSQTAYAQWVFDSVSCSDIEVSETDYVDCIDCDGSGICVHCDGKGKVTAGYASWGCTLCKRSGKCSTCGGSGELTEVEYVIQRNIDNTPTGYIKTGSADDLYACRYCFGTGLCARCSGDGVNDTTGNACVYCKQDVGICDNCSGYGCLTRDEHNERLAENAARRSGSGSNTTGEDCTKCGGTGNSSTLCHECGGTGKYDGSSVVIRGMNQNKCLSCDGRKYEKCSYCKGTGKQ